MRSTRAVPGSLCQAGCACHGHPAGSCVARHVAMRLMLPPRRASRCACCLGKALHAQRGGPPDQPNGLSRCPAASCAAHDHAPDAAAAPPSLTLRLRPRRLSRPSSSELCGRITMFLTQLLPLLDRSGVNVQGAFNDSHSTPVEDVPEVSSHRVTEASSSRVAAQPKA